MFGFDLLDDTDEEAMFSLLDRAESALKVETRREGGQALAAEDAAAVAILLEMIQFRRTYYQLVSQLTGLKSATITTELPEAARLNAVARASIGRLRALVAGFDTAACGADACFDAVVNRALLGSAPVKTVKLESVDGALGQLERSVACLEHAGDMMGCESLDELYRFLNSGSHESDPILSRSVMAMNLYLDELLIGTLPFATAISYAMNEFGIPKVNKYYKP